MDSPAPRSRARYARAPAPALAAARSLARSIAASVGLSLVIAACADAPAAPDPDKRAALREFAAAYRLADEWPRMAPKIARDSLPRLEDAVHADIDADPLPADARAAAHRRVPALLPRGRAELAAALAGFDANELADWAADSVYGRYFDTAEIRALAAFYDSPTGRRLSALTPEILAETRQPGAKDVLARHFDEAQLREIVAFWRSPAGEKLSASAGRVREDLHAHFVEKSEPALQAVARRIAGLAEQGAGAPASSPAR